MLALIIGSVTIDDIGNELRVGGSVYYGGKALRRFPGVEVHVLTPLDTTHKEFVVEIFEGEGINVHSIVCESIPVFVIRSGKALGLRAGGCPIGAEEVIELISDLRPDILILAPVFRELDFKTAVLGLDEVKVDGGISSVDIQGFVREVSNGITCVWDEGIYDVINRANLTHGNLREYCFSSDVAEVLQVLQLNIRSYNASVAVTRDSGYSYLISKYEVYEVPTLKVIAVDEVGAGDVLTAVATYHLALGDTPKDAFIKGSIAASLKVSRPYGDWFTLEEIDKYFNELRKGLKIFKPAPK